MTSDPFGFIPETTQRAFARERRDPGEDPEFLYLSDLEDADWDTWLIPPGTDLRRMTVWEVGRICRPLVEAVLDLRDTALAAGLCDSSGLEAYLTTTVHPKHFRRSGEIEAGGKPLDLAGSKLTAAVGELSHAADRLHAVAPHLDVRFFVADAFPDKRWIDVEPEIGARPGPYLDVALPGGRGAYLVTHCVERVSWDGASNVIDSYEPGGDGAEMCALVLRNSLSGRITREDFLKAVENAGFEFRPDTEPLFRAPGGDYGKDGKTFSTWRWSNLIFRRLGQVKLAHNLRRGALEELFEECQCSRPETFRAMGFSRWAQDFAANRRALAEDMRKIFVVGGDEKPLTYLCSEDRPDFD